MTDTLLKRRTLLTRLLPLLLVLGLGACAAVERLAAPDPVLVDPLWRFRQAVSAEVVDYSPWEDFLSKYVRPGQDGINRVAYGAVSHEDGGALKAHLQRLGRVRVSALSGDAQLAYWINLYNALTVDLILDHYPVSSITAISISPGLFVQGPWRKTLIVVEDRWLSLDDIEHGILRPLWHDPRIHYAVNCASLGCPNLAVRPYSAARIDRQLEAAARAYINHPRGLRVDAKGRLVASKIYNWFSDDFGGGDARVLDHLRAYAEGATAKFLDGRDRIDDYEYDWSLNVAE